MFRHGHLYPGSIEAIRRLAQIGDVVIVTHRPASAVPDTLAWLAYNQFPLRGVHILSNEQSKAGVGPFDLFIDDKPENCAELVATGARVATPDRRWNRGRDIPAVDRVYSWGEFVALAEKVATCNPY